MIQTLDIITINIWSILISLANLVLLFFILKRFLYKPMKKVLEERRLAVDKQYEDADKAKLLAEESKEAWEKKLETANAEANAIITTAEQKAQNRSDVILIQANEKAESIIKRAESDAELERKKAETDIKKEIAEVSAALAEKMLEREINIDDHRNLIETFINEVGDNNG